MSGAKSLDQKRAEYEKDIWKCSEDYNSLLKQQMDFAESILGATDDIQKARELLNTMFQNFPLELLERSVDKFIKFAEQIIKKNSDFFMKSEDYKKFIKDKSSYSDYQYKMASLIKSTYPKLSEEQKDKLWILLNKMLQVMLRYKMLLKNKPIR